MITDVKFECYGDGFYGCIDKERNIYDVVKKDDIERADELCDVALSNSQDGFSGSPYSSPSAVS